MHIYFVSLKILFYFKSNYFYSAKGPERTSWPKAVSAGAGGRQVRHQPAGGGHVLCGEPGRRELRGTDRWNGDQPNRGK